MHELMKKLHCHINDLKNCFVKFDQYIDLSI